MKEELIKFETAKLAKEKGFDWGCNNYFRLWYNEAQERVGSFINYNGIKYLKSNPNEDYSSRPTQSLLQKWLREEHNIIVEIEFYDHTSWCYNLYDHKPILRTKPSNETYELALEVGLIEALKLIKTT